jgi:hypothetical protein
MLKMPYDKMHLIQLTYSLALPILSQKTYVNISLHLRQNHYNKVFCGTEI